MTKPKRVVKIKETKETDDREIKPKAHSQRVRDAVNRAESESANGPWRAAANVLTSSCRRVLALQGWNVIAFREVGVFDVKQGGTAGY